MMMMMQSSSRRDSGENASSLVSMGDAVVDCRQGGLAAAAEVSTHDCSRRGLLGGTKLRRQRTSPGKGSTSAGDVEAEAEDVGCSSNLRKSGMMWTVLPFFVAFF